MVLTRDLRAALERLNPQLPAEAVAEAVQKLTRVDFSRSLFQHNQEFYRYIRDGVPVSYRDAQGQLRHAQARVIDFQNGTGPDGQPNNRFLAVRELKITGLRAPSYNRRADLVCFVNGLPLVFIELKAVYKNIRAGFDGNLRDYLDENVIAHAFHHNAFLIVSNGHRARYGSITSQWEHFAEWKRQDERDKGSVEAEVLLDGMLAHDRLLDLVENFILFDDSKPGATRKIAGAQSSGAGRQQRGGFGLAPGGTEERVSAGEAAGLSRDRAAEGRGRGCATCCPCRRRDRGREGQEAAAPGGIRASRSWQARRLLAHPGQRQVVFDGVLRREGAAADFGQVHLPADDRPQRPGQPDLPDVRRLRRGR